MNMSIRIRATRVCVVLCTALLCGPALAHDFWIEPGSFTPRLGEPVSVRLRVGERLQGEPVPFVPAWVNQFIVQDGANRRTVFARSGSEPAGALRIVNAGLHVVGYHSHASRVELPADKFDAYLIEEGLDAVAAQRAQRPANDGKVRERFIRCAKSLVLAGAPGEEQGGSAARVFRWSCWRKATRTARPKLTELQLRLTYEDRPLAGALVVAMNSRNPADKQSLRSDAEGRVRFRVLGGGFWLVKAVHMVAGACR